ncbi:PsiF family protein [Microvirga terricola]|uniref:Phosphate-starvation-inducible protein PsiF n=1 Tax=Microvirga terricola TaxID=2719797 RepID=A0ABX0VH08_9HYPH|nr:PsiF family protein [Microvirga terricola]NIX78120.1 phosphate-starvation-inducible protein PsiF [Microvirga terricola]
MRTILAVASAFLALSLMPVSAQTATSPSSHGLSSQQERMKSCNTEAGTKKLSGDSRKTFMSDCLSGKTGSVSSDQNMSPQQMKMKECNVKAKTMKGDARKNFMSNCLKG